MFLSDGHENRPWFKPLPSPAGETHCALFGAERQTEVAGRRPWGRRWSHPGAPLPRPGPSPRGAGAPAAHGEGAHHPPPFRGPAPPDSIAGYLQPRRGGVRSTAAPLPTLGPRPAPVAPTHRPHCWSPTHRGPHCWGRNRGALPPALTPTSDAPKQ